MFTARLALRSNNPIFKTCLSANNSRVTIVKKKHYGTEGLEKLIFKVKKINDMSLAFHPANFYSTFTRRFSIIDNYEKLELRRKYATGEAAKKFDVFGEIADEQYHKFEMDEDEKEEEKFVENEARVHRRYKLTPGGYAKLIKSHIEKGDLKSALEVLNLIKLNRDQPTVYMYNLLLRAHAVTGDFKKSRSLYTTMKKRGMKLNDATYTSILNACANYHHSETALNYLGDLRQEFMEKNITLNETHYNTMIKAYARHKNILEAFTIADEMRDKHLPTGEITFNSLLIGAISDKESGLRHALIVWHLMRKHNIRPTINTYNLLLRAIRDTKLGDLKVNDILISNDVTITLDENAKPDLLERRPCVNSLMMTRIAAQESEINEDKSEINSIDKNNSSDNLPVTIDSQSDEKKLALVKKKLIATPLQKIHRKNRLILFGGVNGILEKMEKDKVVPDTKTMTILMEIVPASAAAEQQIIKTAKTKKIPLDLDFYNMLMKKRSIRRDYEGAKAILDDIQRSGFSPDIITWGMLAMGCQTSEDARTLIEGMYRTGHRLNAVIAGTLINIACKKIRFGYILEMMETMKKYQVKPNWELFVTLDAFQKEMEEMIKSKKFTRTVNHPAFKTGFSKFNCRYVTWKEEMSKKPQELEEKINETQKGRKR